MENRKMKTYFEVDGFILPFDKVIASHQARIDYGVHKVRCHYSSDGFVDVSFEDFANYKSWLDSRSNLSEIPNSCSCSGKANDSKHIEDNLEMVFNRKITKERLSTINMTIGTLLDNIDEINEDHLDEMLRSIAFTANAMVKQELNHLPDVGKTMLNKKQVKKVIDYVQTFYGYNGYLESDEFVKAINELINEV